MNFKLISIFIGVFFTINSVFSQPSNDAVKQKVRQTYSGSDIVSIELGPGKSEKQWERDRYVNYWYKTYTIKTKTEYPGVVAVSYGGVQYIRSGSSYSFDNMLTNGFDRYEGIPTPSSAELNSILKENFDPITFYPNYLLGYIVDAPNTIEVAPDPKFKWIDLNELRCEVTATYERKVNDIGGMREQRGVFEVVLQRSADGVTYDENAKLLLNGKWLPVGLGFKKKEEVIREYTLSKPEQDAMKTLKELGAERMAEDFKNSLVKLDLPEFQSANHFIQFIHEMLLEGDEEKVTSLLYNMLPRSYFEEWSDIVLNQNGKDMMASVLSDLENYKRAFCIHPEIKSIQAGQVSFYDRSKYRHNRIQVFYENDRWYIGTIRYVIRDEDYAKHEANGDTNCEGDLIFIDGEPAFSPGDPIEVYSGGRWIAGEVVRPEMKNGGYHVTYGVSGLKEWFYANDVRGRELSEDEKFKEFETGANVKARYANIWYNGIIKSVSYDTEKYLVEIPDRGTEVWLASKDLEAASGTAPTSTKEDEGEESDDSTKKKKKLNLRIPDIKL